jgi:hypothetical protein
MLLGRALGLFLLAATAGGVVACSSSGRRDQYYGTDAGRVYMAPETGPRVDVPPSADAGVGDVNHDVNRDVNHDVSLDTVTDVTLDQADVIPDASSDGGP